MIKDLTIIKWIILNIRGGTISVDEIFALRDVLSNITEENRLKINRAIGEGRVYGLKLAFCSALENRDSEIRKAFFHLHPDYSDRAVLCSIKKMFTEEDQPIALYVFYSNDWEEILSFV